MEFVTENKDGTSFRFVDRKRWQWPLSLVLPLLPLSAFGLYFFAGGYTAYLVLPIVYFFVILPIADGLVGGDSDNPPEEVVPLLAHDRYYQRLVYALIPAHYVLFAVTTWFVATIDIPFWAIAVLAIGIGTINGNMINVGHELGHKTGRVNRFFAKLALSLSGYGHFIIEHNRGHHMRVATPEDCASSRFGESVYAFALRELPGTLRGGWTQERKRLASRNRSFWHWSNEILQVYLATVFIAASLVLWLGWPALLFIIVHHCFSWFALTQINYVEHYGLLREKLPSGKYEKCLPRHSWNANHRLSNLLLLQLQRHSDHHAYPRRPYQCLRDCEDAPSLPSGYSGCIVLAAIPLLWFKVMNPRVLAWAGGDLSKVNDGSVHAPPLANRTEAC